MKQSYRNKRQWNSPDVKSTRPVIIWGSGIRDLCSRDLVVPHHLTHIEVSPVQGEAAPEIPRLDRRESKEDHHSNQSTTNVT